VKRDTTHELDVVGPLADLAGCHLARDGEGFGKEVFEALSLRVGGFELDGLFGELLIAKCGRFLRVTVDLVDDAGESLQFLLVRVSEEAIDDYELGHDSQCTSKA